MGLYVTLVLDYVKNLAATHDVCERTGRGPAEVLEALHVFDFSRQGTALHGTLVEPPADGVGAGRALTGRDSWEGAAKAIAAHMSRSWGR